MWYNQSDQILNGFWKSRLCVDAPVRVRLVANPLAQARTSKAQDVPEWEFLFS